MGIFLGMATAVTIDGAAAFAGLSQTGAAIVVVGCAAGVPIWKNLIIIVIKTIIGINISRSGPGVDDPVTLDPDSCLFLNQVIGRRLS